MLTKVSKESNYTANRDDVPGDQGVLGLEFICPARKAASLGRKHSERTRYA